MSNLNDSGIRRLTDRLSESADDLRASNARLRAVINIGLELASERDAERLLHHVCTATRELFDATYVTLGILNLTDRTVEKIVTCGHGPDWAKAGDTVSGLLATVVAERRAARGDRGADPNGVPSLFAALPPEVQAFLVAPIASPATVFGWLCLVGNDGRTFSEDDEDLVKAISGLVGRIYENVHFSSTADKRAKALEHEMSERRRAEALLRTERNRAQRYLDTAQVMLVALDCDGRIELVNRYACSVLGSTAAQLQGRDWFDTCLPAGIREEFRQKFPGLLRGELPAGHNPVITRSGEERLIEWQNTVLHDDDGNFAGTLSSGTDITERRVLEERYQQTQKMDAVGRVVGGVAHDFNNLLTVILGYCELALADLTADDPRRADIIEIERAGARATALARQLLTFSRKEVTESRLLDLNQVVAGMRAMLGLLISEDVTVVITLAPEPAAIEADQGQVEQIIMNLAVNARDAMPHGGTLTIETATVATGRGLEPTITLEPGPYVVLTITDTGTGMPPQVLARLFEPFFTTKEPGKGTGLGMPTVLDIVKRHGGDLAVSSEVGKGTSVRVYLPKAGQAAAATVSTLPVAAPKVQSRKILVVDDSKAICDLTKKLLERRGYKVKVATDVGEALRQFEHDPSIEVLLTDVVMPGASGPELTRQLLERHPGLKVIYMSGYTDDALARHGVLTPGVAFLRKPFNAESLEQKLRDVLNRPGRVVV
ncbi:MAG: ATP-binding protein [Acidobacteriota bacterium]|nr:ATP-binding protein [Acidobacteriota bacterium]